MAKQQPRREGVKYLLVPTWVTDERTGERKHVTAAELIRLYNLPPRSYRLVSDKPSVPDNIARAKAQGLVILYPDGTGKYQIPEPTKKGETPEEAPSRLTDQLREDNKETEDLSLSQPIPEEALDEAEVPRKTAKKRK